MKPGIYVMDAAKYHGDPCAEPSLSASIATILLQQSAWHAWHAHPRLNPHYERQVDEKFDLGTATHAYFLEGDANVTVVHQRDWRTRLAQDLRDEARAQGKLPLLVQQWERVQQMAEAIGVQLGAFPGRKPFTEGRPEETLIWQEPNGIWCRGRMDWVATDETWIDDLKTVGGTANPEVWTRGPLFNLGYDVQAAFYLRGLKALGGPADATFRFVVVENEPPFALSAISLSPAALDLAQRKVQHAINIWAECLDKNHWPGYPTETCYADAPPWEEARWMERQARDWTLEPRIVDDGRPIGELLP